MSRLVWRQLQCAIREAMGCENQTSRDSLSTEFVGDNGGVGEANLRGEFRTGRWATRNLKWIADDFDAFAGDQRRKPARSFVAVCLANTGF